MKRFLNYILSWLAAPALLAAKDEQIEELRERIRDLEDERRKLQDSFLLKNGAYPLYPEPLPPPTQQDSSSPFDQWKRVDIERELQDLHALAESDPETYGPLFEEAAIRYREEFK